MLDKILLVFDFADGYLFLVACRLEHLNLVVGDMAVAKKFYVDFLGLTPDHNPKHFNLGQQQVSFYSVVQSSSRNCCFLMYVFAALLYYSQFHLAANDDPPQRITGSVGLTVPSLQSIRARAEDARSQLEGTQFSIVEDDKDNIMIVSCPWGNIFHLYDISIDNDHQSTGGASQSSQQKMTKMHVEGGIYGPQRVAVRGSPGIR